MFSNHKIHKSKKHCKNKNGAQLAPIKIQKIKDPVDMVAFSSLYSEMKEVICSDQSLVRLIP